MRCFSTVCCMVSTFLLVSQITGKLDIWKEVLKTFHIMIILQKAFEITNGKIYVDGKFKTAINLFKFKSKYRKIPNISPCLQRFVSIFWGLIFGGLIFGGDYIRRAFCVTVPVSRPQNSLLYIVILGKKGFLRPKAPLFCFKTYLKPC